MSTMAFTRRVGRAALAATLSLAAPLRATDPAPDPDKSLTTISIDLRKGTLDANLPFDEPFILTGSGPTDLLEVKVRYFSHQRDIHVIENPDLCTGLDSASNECRVRRRDCADDPNPKPNDPDCYACKERRTSFFRGGPLPWTDVACPRWEPDSPLHWRFNELEWANAGTKADRTFAVTVPALEAERHYSFHISLRTSSQEEALAATEKKLQDQIATLFVAEIDELPPSSDEEVAREEVELCVAGDAAAVKSCQDLPATLCNDLRQLEAVERVEFEPNFLCADDNETKLPTELSRQVSDLVGSSVHVTMTCAARSRQINGFFAQLAELHGQLAPRGNVRAPLDKLRLALETAAASDVPDAPRAKELLAGLEPGYKIAGSGTAVQKALALGVDAAASPLPDASMVCKDAEVATALAAGYAQTAKSLEAFREGLSEFLTGVPSLLIGRWIDGETNKKLPLTDRLTRADLAGSSGTIEDLLGKLLAPTVDRAQSLALNSDRLADGLGERRAAAETLAAQLLLVKAQASFWIDGRAFAAFQTQQTNYISADLGVIYAPELDEVIPTIGANIYLRPINKNVPLSLKGGFKRRFAFTFGVTMVEEIGDGDSTATPPIRGTREDLVNGHSLLLGAGYRLSDSARLTVGTLVFYEFDPNPLLDERHVSYTPFVALSFDWDIASAFGGVFKQLGLTQ